MYFWIAYLKLTTFLIISDWTLFWWAVNQISHYTWSWPCSKLTLCFTNMLTFIGSQPWAIGANIMTCIGSQPQAIGANIMTHWLSTMGHRGKHYEDTFICVYFCQCSTEEHLQDFWQNISNVPPSTANYVLYRFPLQATKQAGVNFGNSTHVPLISSTSDMNLASDYISLTRSSAETWHLLSLTAYSKMVWT